jgi:hypothetical protein
VTRGFALLGVAALVVATPARAQSGARLSTQVSSRSVEVGEAFQYQVTVQLQSGSEAPKRPRLKVPAGITAQGPNLSTQRQVTVTGMQIEQRLVVTATWVLQARRAGRFVIGPATLDLAGHALRGQTLTVTVVPVGQGAPRRHADPFGMFGGPRGFPQFPGFPALPGLDPSDEFGDRELEDSVSDYPPELGTNRALDPVAFLHATISPAQAVVGQQMVLKVIAYGASGPYREGPTAEPRRPDFLSHRVLENSYDVPRYRVPIEGRAWFALKIREWVVFPLRAGTLPIGPMQMVFAGSGYASAAAPGGLSRSSEPLEVTVTEPPLENRPPGYHLGDVGRYTLTASVQPREVTAGDAISVVVTIQGAGNFPATVRVPQQRGVDWLEPTVVDDLGVRSNEYSGSRKLTYVVRLDQPGRVDLGEITLPYWDPGRHAYTMERTGLGSVEVRPGATAEPRAAGAPPDPLADLAVPRRTLGAAAVRPWQPASEPRFWALLGLGPLLTLGVRGSARLVQLVRGRRRANRESFETRVADALRTAGTATDAAAAASCVERASFLALEKATGLRARAFLREELPGRLAGAGLPAELVAEFIALLDDLDSLRFTGTSSEASSAEFLERARVLTSHLLRRVG